jgi:hypothetical protein
MLTKRALEVIRHANPKDDVAFIVSVSDRPSASDVERLRDRSARRKFVDDHYRRVKAPVLEVLRALEPSGVRLVDTLEGTPDVVIAGPASVWRHVLSEAQSVFSNPAVIISTNEPDVYLP